MPFSSLKVKKTILSGRFRAYNAVLQGHTGKALDLNGLAAQAVHETDGDVVARKPQQGQDG